MKLKQLEMFLENIDGFKNPKIHLEQYETGPHIGSRMLFTINDTYDDIFNKNILDLGCGCGRLGLSCAYLQASFVLGIDIDQDALEQCRLNWEKLKDEDADEDDDEESSFLNNFDLLCADICSDDKFWLKFENFFDTVIMNPPFGTKNNKGIDLIFLQRAGQLSKKVVYSLHKTSTREFVLKKSKEFGFKKVEVLAKLNYNLPKTYKFHTKSTKDIEVDFFRFEK